MFSSIFVILLRKHRSCIHALQAPNVNGNISVAASGVGVGVAQLSVCYNIPNDPFEGEPFACTVKVKESNYLRARIDFCCR